VGAVAFYRSAQLLKNIPKIKMGYTALVRGARMLVGENGMPQTRSLKRLVNPTLKNGSVIIALNEVLFKNETTLPRKDESGI